MNLDDINILTYRKHSDRIRIIKFYPELNPTILCDVINLPLVLIFRKRTRNSEIYKSLVFYNIIALRWLLYFVIKLDCQFLFSLHFVTIQCPDQ